MPNKNTFEIKPIKSLIDKYSFGKIIDPFANKNKIANVTNDLDEQYDTDYHMDALSFLKMFDDNSVNTVLYDPPYSVRQVSEVYRKLGQSVNMETTQATYWSKQKEQIGRIVKKMELLLVADGIVMELVKNMALRYRKFFLVPHGGAHNDTIVVVDKKIR